MQLSDLQSSWFTLTKEGKESLIESTNERRLASFKTKTKKKTKKKKKTSKRVTKKERSMSKNPKKMAKFINGNMTKEQRDNFLLMLQTQNSKSN